MKIDYEHKSKVLKNTELLRQQKLISKALFKNADIVDYKTGEIMSVDDAKFLDMVLCLDPDYIEAKKINKSSYERSRKLGGRIRFMLEKGTCQFITLTFSEDVLNNTTAETRKQYVRKYLKSQCEWYVANIDFGAKNGREHYHAVVLADKVNYSLWHKNGGIKGETVRSNGVSDKKLGKYISKLTNHAIKETTKRQAIIYGTPNKATASA